MSNDTGPESQNMGFDLGNLTTADEKEIEIYDLRREPTGIFFIVAGPYSPVAVEFNRKMRLRQQRFLRRIGSPRKMTEAQEQEFSELNQQLVRDKLIEMVRGWYHCTPDGKRVDGKVPFRKNLVAYSPAMVREVLEAAPVVEEQLAAALMDEGNFLPD